MDTLKYWNNGTSKNIFSIEKTNSISAWKKFEKKQNLPATAVILI